MNKIAILAQMGAGSPIVFGASEYGVPLLSWLTGQFYTDYRARIFDESNQDWLPKWPCREFARSFACFAQEAWAKTPGTPDGETSVLVGEYWFKPDASRGMPVDEGHAVCFALTDQGLVYIDPQNGTLWQMSDTERDSNYFRRL